MHLDIHGTGGATRGAPRGTPRRARRRAALRGAGVPPPPALRRHDAHARSPSAREGGPDAGRRRAPLQLPGRRPERRRLRRRPRRGRRRARRARLARARAAGRSPRLACGFSFGAWIALVAGGGDPGVRGLLLAGLALRSADLDVVRDTAQVTEIEKPIAIVQAANDEFGTADEVRLALAGLARPSPARGGAAARRISSPRIWRRCSARRRRRSPGSSGSRAQTSLASVRGSDATRARAARGSARPRPNRRDRPRARGPRRAARRDRTASG